MFIRRLFVLWNIHLVLKWQSKLFLSVSYVFLVPSCRVSSCPFMSGKFPFFIWLSLTEIFYGLCIDTLFLKFCDRISTGLLISLYTFFKIFLLHTSFTFMLFLFWIYLRSFFKTLTFHLIVTPLWVMSPRNWISRRLFGYHSTFIVLQLFHTNYEPSCRLPGTEYY